MAGAAPDARQQSTFFRAAIRIGPSAGVCNLRDSRRGGWPSVRGIHQALADHAAVVPAAPGLDLLVSACRGGVGGGADCLASATSPRRGVWICRRSPQRQNGALTDGLVGGLQTSSSDDKLCFGKRGRHFWPQLVHWSDAGGRAWKRGAPFFAGLHSGAWRLRARRHGGTLRRNRARPDDVRADDL